MTDDRTTEQPYAEWRAGMKARCKAVQDLPLPWTVQDVGAVTWFVSDANGFPLADFGGTHLPKSKFEALAKLFQSARTDLPRADRELDRLTAEVERAEHANELLTMQVNGLAARVRELEQRAAAEQQAMPVRFSGSKP